MKRSTLAIFLALSATGCATYGPDVERDLGRPLHA